MNYIVILFICIDDHQASVVCSVFFFQAEDGIRDLVRSRGLGDVYKRQVFNAVNETNHVGTKNFDIPELKQIKVKGKFKDCNAQSLSNGFIKIQNGPKTEYIYIPETDFEWQIPLCVAGPLSFGSAGINGEKMSDIRFQTNTAEMGNIFLCQGIENQYTGLRTQGGNNMYSGDNSLNDQEGI